MQSKSSIRYFISDLDGCISEPFTVPDWQLLSTLRDLSDRSHKDSNIPKLGICTGRPAAYAESISLLLNVQLPVLFESGTGLLDLSTQSIELNPMLPENAREVSQDVRAFFESLKEKYPEINLENKIIDVGITCANTSLVIDILPEAQTFIENNHPLLELHYTDISFNVLWPQTNKGAGLRWFCEKHNIQPSEIAYIGDTGGDVPALELVGLGFAPSNAHQAAKQAADIVTKEPCTAGVIEAWQSIIESQ